MSLDKFVMRGFSSSLGSGEGNWVTKTQQYQGPTQQQTVVRHEGGTSFVMGGGPLKGKPNPKQGRDTSYKEDRYSFDAEAIRNGGTMRRRKSSGGHGADEGVSLVEAANTNKGHKIAVGIAMYGILLAVGIVLLIVYFGDGSNEGFYSAPAGLSGDVRPMWER
jgi:hypothetical protein